LARRTCNQTPHAIGKRLEQTIQNISRIVENKAPIQCDIDPKSKGSVRPS
jgi:hypothetical protein